MRPPDPAFGEDETALARARARGRRARAARPPHALDGARPRAARPAATPASASRAEGARLRELGLAPTLFCGGGWYTDADVAEACAELGYVDCTPRGAPAAVPRRPASAGPRSPRPRVVELPSGRTLLADPDDALARRPRARAPAAAMLPGRSSTSTSTTRTCSTAAGGRSSGVVLRAARAPRRVDRPRRARARASLPPRPTRRVGRRGAALSFHGMSGKVAPPAETPRGLRRARLGTGRRRPRLPPLPPLARADPRRSSGARSRSPRSSSSTSPGSRSASTSPSSSGSSSPATATSSGACSGARARPSGSSSSRPITVLVFAQAGLYRQRERRPGAGRILASPHRRRAHRARVRDRHGLRLLDLRPHPDRGRRLRGRRSGCSARPTSRSRSR